MLDSNRLRIISCLFAFTLVCAVNGLEEKRFCGDPDCQEPISRGTALKQYRANKKGKVSFEILADIKVLSKSAENGDLWYVEVNNQRGYAPKSLIKETKVLISKNALIEVSVPVDVESSSISTGNVEGDVTTTATSDIQRQLEATLPKNKDDENNSEEMGKVLSSPPIEGHDHSKPNEEIVSTQNKNISIGSGNKADLKDEVNDGKGQTSTEFKAEAAATENIKQIKDLNLTNNIDEPEPIDGQGVINSLEKQNETVNKINDSKGQTNPEDIKLSSSREKFAHQEVQNSENYGEKLNISSHFNETIIKESEQSNQENNEIKDPVQVGPSEENQVKNKENWNNVTGRHNENYVNATEIGNLPSEHIVNGSVQPQRENIEDKLSEITVLSSEKGEKLNKVTGNQNQNDTKEEIAAVETWNIPSNSNETKETLTIPNLENPAINTQVVKGENLTNAENTVVSEQGNKSDFIVKENLPDGNSLNTRNDDSFKNTNNTANNNELFQSNNVKSTVSPVYSENPTKFDYSSSENLEQKTDNDSNIVVGSREDITANETLREKNSVNSISNPVMPIVPFNSTSSQEEDNSVQKNIVQQTSTQNSQTEKSPKTFKIQESRNHYHKQNPLGNISDIANITDTYQTTTPGTQGDIQNSELKDAVQYSSQDVNEIDEHISNHNNVHENKYHSKAYGSQPDGNNDKMVEEKTITAKHDEDESDNFDNAQVFQDIHYQQTTEVNHHEYSTPTFREFDSEPTTPPPALAFTSTSSPPPSLSSSPSPSPSETIKHQQQELFATILGTVNSFLSNDKSEKVKRNSYTDHERIQPVAHTKENVYEAHEFCEKFPADIACSKSDSSDSFINQHSVSFMDFPWNIPNISIDQFTDDAVKKILDMSDMIVCLVITAISTLIFMFGYYCFCSNNKESELLSKLNFLERNLLATNKENIIFKHDLMETRNKLSSIEDSSFGSNEMVMSLKKEMEAEVAEKQKLQEQVGNLEKELENAAEAGLELNKIVSELLSNQTGDESIISSVEELQKQLNEQQNTILEINTNLAEKSRENSELQLMIAEQHTRLSGQISSLQQDNDELEAEKSNLQTQLEEVKTEFEKDITKALDGKNMEIQRLQVEIAELKTNCEETHAKWQTCLAKIEALEECLRSLKKDSKINIKDIIDGANVRAEIIDLQKQKMSLKELFEAEKDARNLLEEQVKMFTSEVEKLKHNFHQSEKDKLEAQTRLEVLANYFKEKETQLQKELSLKEAMWLKQQGEKTSTVDRLTSMQTEIQALKSQNDNLRAEIEAQLAAHKAQTGTLENRAHETWLAARQSERRYEEARAEATALRRKLTSLAGINGNEVNDAKLGTEQRNAPSPNAPNQLETPELPLVGRMPPPPPFLPPPFMGPVPPFMRIPPPFIPPGQMRPPPMGRLMSPPPPTGAPTHSTHLRSRHYTPSDHGDFDNYDDDDDDDDDDDGENEISQHTRGGYRWPSPAAGRYRSHSPPESRYSRDAMDTYGFRSETDYSPPPSPRGHHTRGSRSGSFKTYSPPPTASSPISDTGRKGTMSRNKGSRFMQSAFRKENKTTSDSESASGNSDGDANVKRLYKW